MRGHGELRVEQQRPARQRAVVACSRQRELNLLVVRIYEQQLRRVLPALLDAGCLRAAVQQHAETARRAVGPIVVAHLRTVDADPRDFLDADGLVYHRRQETITSQDWIPPT